MRTLAIFEAVEPWSLTSPREKLIKIGAKVGSHGRCVTFRMAGVAVWRDMPVAIAALIAGLPGRPSRQHEVRGVENGPRQQQRCASMSQRLCAVNRLVRPPLRRQTCGLKGSCAIAINSGC